LKWSQVDLIRRIVRLEAGETKNKEPRIIPLYVDDLYQSISILRTERDQRYPKCPWVFSREGERVRDFRAAWDDACEAAGLWDAKKERPTRIFHDLRRSGVRNLRRAGVSEGVAMKISGHKTRAVFERYNIDDERDVIEAMKRLDAYTRDRADQEKVAEERAAENLAHISAHKPTEPN
jgi:integrase